jgi:hypothetical protein
MEALDGNAIAGQLVEVFGAEMTTVTGTCGTCGESGQMAQLVVYVRAPGTVARCRTCDSVLLVVTRVRGLNCVDLAGFADVGTAA